MSNQIPIYTIFCRANMSNNRTFFCKSIWKSNVSNVHIFTLLFWWFLPLFAFHSFLSLMQPLKCELMPRDRYVTFPPPLWRMSVSFQCVLTKCQHQTRSYSLGLTVNGFTFPLPLLVLCLAWGQSCDHLSSSKTSPPRLWKRWHTLFSLSLSHTHTYTHKHTLHTHTHLQWQLDNERRDKHRRKKKRDFCVHGWFRSKLWKMLTWTQSISF